ncbi:MAG TPA: hypothetical protein VF859_13290 [Burkholderiales bacterium]
MQEEGADAFEARLANALPLSAYLIRELSSRTDPGSVDGRARLVELARPLIRRIPSDVYRELLIQQLAEAVRMPAARLGELLGGGDAPEPRRPEPGLGTRHLRTPAGPAVGRGNLVRQAISLLVHHPSAATGIGGLDALARVDRPGIPLLVELLAQLREDPPASTGALLERWRDRPEHGPLARLAAGECLVQDAAAAAAEIRSAVERLVAEEAVLRLQALQDKARQEDLSTGEKAELQALIRSIGQSSRAQPAK